MSRRTLLIPLAAALLALSAAGQEPKKDEKPDAPKTVLRWFGQSFFQLETATKQKIVFDPHAIPNFGRPVVKADFVLITHPHVDHSIVEVLEGLPEDPKKRENEIYRGVVEPKPGRQEWKKIDEKRGPIRFRTLATYHDAANGMKYGKNSAWIVEADGFVFCHLGDLGHELTPEQVKAIGPVDVLMIPVGGVYTLNGEAAKRVVEQIKPRLYVVPMHYGTPGFDDLVGPEEFLDGQKNVKRMTDTNELVLTPGMKAPEAPTVVLLGWEKKEPPPKK